MAILLPSDNAQEVGRLQCVTIGLRGGCSEETIVDTDAMAARTMPLHFAGTGYRFCTVWLTCSKRWIAEHKNAASEYITQHHTHRNCPLIPLLQLRYNMNVTEFMACMQIICGTLADEFCHENNFSYYNYFITDFFDPKFASRWRQHRN